MRWGTVVLRGITGIALLALPAATTGGQRSAGPKIIHIVAERFVFTPSEISVEEGTAVEFRISSDDTSHGFRLTGPGDSGSAGAIDLEIPKRGRGEARATFLNRAGPAQMGPPILNIDAHDYGARVERIRELIGDGDVYQVNFTVRERADFEGDPLRLYACLRESSRAGAASRERPSQATRSRRTGCVLPK